MRPYKYISTYVVSIVVVLALANTVHYSYAQSGDSYIIKGIIEKLPNNKEYYAFLYNTTTNVFDSAKVINRNFSFKKNHNNRPNIAILTIANKNDYEKKLSDDKYTKELLLVNGVYNLHIKDVEHIRKATTNAPAIQYDFEKYTELTQKYFKNLLTMQQRMQNSNLSNTEKSKLFDDIQDAISSIQETTKNFVKTHNNSTFSLALINLLLNGNIINSDIAKSFYTNLNSKLKQSDYGKETIKAIEKAKLTQPVSLAEGSIAPDFELPSLDGSKINLKDFKNKWVLIDFWASWCGPCRIENPNLVKAYEKFKDKNFTILGVSLDNKEERWKRTIVSDKLNWPQVSDLKGWRSPVARLYNINAIPANFLISPDGKIVTKDLRGKNLHKVLEKLLN